MSEWELSKFKDHFSIGLRNGLNKPSRVRGSGVRMVNMKEIFGYDFIDDKTPMELVPVSEKEFQSSNLEYGDLLFARQSLTEAGAGKVAIYRGIQPAVFESHLIRCRINKQKSDPTFLYYLFKSPLGKGAVSTIVHQVAAAGIKGSDLQELEFQFPEIQEQKAIASVLSSLDDKIDLLHRQNTTIEAMAETLFRQWFVEEAQANWITTKLGEILSCIESGSRPKGGIDPDLQFGIPSIGAENINGLGKYMHSKTKFITNEFFQSMKRGVIQDFDVLVYKDGAYVGRKAMFGKGYPFDVCSVNEHVFILRGNEKINQFFLYFLLQEEDLALLNTNSAQPGLNQESMKSFEILLPPINLINDFAEVVSPSINKIFQNGIQIRTLEKLRDTLLPKLMSGEVRIQDD